MKTKEEIKKYKKIYNLENKEKNSLRAKLYYQKNKEKLKEKAREYREDNKQVVNEKNRNYRKNNKEKINKYFRERKKTDFLFKVKVNLRKLLYNSLNNKGYKKNIKTEQILGCSLEFFKQYVECQFNEWQNWNNWGLFKKGEIATPKKYWQIDHIIPLASAKTVEDIVKLNHYSNLRVLDAYTNLVIKRDKR